MNGEKYEVGDQLVCIPGFQPIAKSGGAGYANGKVFIVERMSESVEGDPDNIIYWPEGKFPHNYGLRGRAVKRAESIINTYPIY